MLELTTNPNPWIPATNRGNDGSSFIGHHTPLKFGMVRMLQTPSRHSRMALAGIQVYTFPFLDKSLLATTGMTRWLMSGRELTIRVLFAFE